MRLILEKLIYPLLIDKAILLATRVQVLAQLMQGYSQIVKV
jgi:hypothetical protein